MVTITPAPETIHTRPDNTVFREFLCPVCKTKQRYENPPAGYAITSTIHACNGKRIHFLNGYAMQGVEEYIGEERVSKAK